MSKQKFDENKKPDTFSSSECDGKTKSSSFTDAQTQTTCSLTDAQTQTAPLKPNNKSKSRTKICAKNNISSTQVNSKKVNRLNCPLCKTGFYTKKALRLHQPKCSLKKGSFECDVCNKRFTLLLMLSRHKRSHFVHKLPCPHCSKSFVHESNLDKHLQQFHIDRKTHHCEVCNKELLSKRNLKDHMSTHSIERPFPCEVCKKSFSTRNNLRKHGQTHNRVKRFMCELCSKPFTRIEVLKRHQKETHLTEKPFSCGICGRAFEESTQLALHEYTQPKHKFSCEMCDRSFHYKHVMQRHSLVHTEMTRDFKCTLCERAFARKDHLRSHMRTVHTEEKYLFYSSGGS